MDQYISRYNWVRSGLSVATEWTPACSWVGSRIFGGAWLMSLARSPHRHTCQEWPLFAAIKSQDKLRRIPIARWLPGRAFARIPRALRGGVGAHRLYSVDQISPRQRPHALQFLHKRGQSLRAVSHKPVGADKRGCARRMTPAAIAGEARVWVARVLCIGIHLQTITFLVSSR